MLYCNFSDGKTVLKTMYHRECSLRMPFRMNSPCFVSITISELDKLSNCNLVCVKWYIFDQIIIYLIKIILRLFCLFKCSLSFLKIRNSYSVTHCIITPSWDFVCFVCILCLLFKGKTTFFAVHKMLSNKIYKINKFLKSLFYLIYFFLWNGNLFRMCNRYEIKYLRS